MVSLTYRDKFTLKVLATDNKPLACSKLVQRVEYAQVLNYGRVRDSVKKLIKLGYVKLDNDLNPYDPWYIITEEGADKIREIWDGWV